MSQDTQAKLDLILSKLDEMNERLQRLESQQNIAEAGEKKEEQMSFLFPHISMSNEVR